MHGHVLVQMTLTNHVICPWETLLDDCNQLVFFISQDQWSVMKIIRIDYFISHHHAPFLNPKILAFYQGKTHIEPLFF